MFGLRKWVNVFILLLVTSFLFAQDYPYVCTWSAFDAYYPLIDKEKTYCFIGDSYTYRYSFQTGFPGTTIYNYAIGSQTISDCVRDQLPLVLALDPDIVFIMIGVNDLHAKGAILASMKESYTALVATIENAGIKVYPLTVIPVPDSWRGTMIDPLIYSWNHWIMETFDNVVDVGLYYSPFTGGGSASSQYYVPDGHLNRAGYYFYIKALFENVEEFK